MKALSVTKVYDVKVKANKQQKPDFQNTLPKYFMQVSLRSAVLILILELKSKVWPFALFHVQMEVRLENHLWATDLI